MPSSLSTALQVLLMAASDWFSKCGASSHRALILPGGAGETDSRLTEQLLPIFSIASRAPLPEGRGSLDLLAELSAWHLPVPSGSFSFTAHLGQCTFRVSSLLGKYTERHQEVFSYFGVLDITHHRLQKGKCVYLKLSGSVSWSAVSLLAFTAPQMNEVCVHSTPTKYLSIVFGCLQSQLLET